MAAMIAHPVCLRPLSGSVRSSQAAQGRAIQLVVRAAAPKAEGARAAAKAIRPADLLPTQLLVAALAAFEEVVALAALVADAT